MEFDVSVVIVTYNPDEKKLFQTIWSCVNQKDINHEIIVADDGSTDFNKSLVEQWFKELDFKDYKIVRLEQNCGTVKNSINGVSVCNGKFVKSISPGDFLYDDTTLSKFYNFCTKTNKEIVFGLSLYYSSSGDWIKYLPEFHYPKDFKPYIKNDTKKIRFNFLILRDLILAPSYLIKTDVYLKYLKLIEGKAKYAEDTVYMLMMADGLEFVYFDYPIVWYEYGFGISTNGSKIWEQRIVEDIKNVGEVLIKRNPEWKIFDDMNCKKKSPRVIFLKLRRKIYLNKKFKTLPDYPLDNLKTILNIRSGSEKNGNQ